MDKTFVEDKERVIQREKQKMQRHLSVGNWTVKEKVALASRILCRHGHESGLAGQITAREAERGFFTQRLGCGMSEVQASNLLLVDEQLRIIEGTGMPNPANRFHAWLYRARKDIQCIVHTHPPYTSALSMLGVPLAVSHMDSCALYENVAFLAHWPGVPVGDEEGKLISAAMGDKSGLLLAHHGMVVVGRSVEEACVLALQFERAAQLQTIAAGAGSIRAIQPELGREARDWLLHPARLGATFGYYARRELAVAPQCIT
ncbi:aldolase [Pendulispora brunnea]|uniref:Aldolase n=1 Tax=Pendulispora brunnea TaxID=2905690 RepID=A0ABZ2KD65_9BACT